MLAFPAAIRIYVAIQPVDMRKSFNGLWSAVGEQLGEDPKCAAVFCFIKPGADPVGAALLGRHGVWVLAKRLERGRFSWPASAEQRPKLTLAPEALALIAGGIELKHGSLKPWYERENAPVRHVRYYRIHALTPEQKIAEYPLLLQRIAALEGVSWFKKQVFGGGKSVKLDPAQRQLTLGVDEARKTIVEWTEKIAYERTIKHLFTKPYPKFIQSAMHERAYARTPSALAQLTVALPTWLQYITGAALTVRFNESNPSLVSVWVTTG